MLRKASCALVLCLSTAAAAQDRGAASLHQLVSGLTVTPRVLVIGAHPDDAPAELLAWLARGQRVQTAYLSLTRGEGAANFLGSASGNALGAIRVQETMAARRVDGAEQYFARAYDFGYARNVDGVFQRWSRDSLVGDIVTVMRSFRPHVVVVTTADPPPAGADAQHQALGPLASDAFRGAHDTTAYSARRFGYAWWPAKLYVLGGDGDLRIDVSARDPVLGMTYGEIGRMSRAQHRSQGLADVLATPPAPKLRRTASMTHVISTPDAGLFEDIDTSFGRLKERAPDTVATLLTVLAVHADSARATLDLARPDSAVRHLARVASLAGEVRSTAAWCRHPAAVVSLPTDPPSTCTIWELDLDASIDLVRQRVVAALIAATGVEIQQHSDRELLAESDTGAISVGVKNHGGFPVTLEQVFHANAIDPADPPVAIMPASSRYAYRRIVGLSDAHPWWIRNLKDSRFPETPTSLEGQLLLGPNFRVNPLLAPSVAIPEHLRHASGVLVTLTIAGATVELRLGDDVSPYADPVVGLQRRTLSGVPDVTLRLGRSLEWIPAGRAVTHSLRVGLQNHSDRPQTVRLGFVTPKGVRIDSVPQLSLEPREQRDLFVRLRATMPVGDKEVFGVTVRRPGRGPIITGYQVIQQPHLRPIRMARQSGLWLQPVDITVPRNLAAVYVPGVSDDVHLALRDVGISVAAVNAEDFHQVNLAGVTTVVFGPRALEAHRDLLAQMPRLMEWVRGGGTLLIQRGERATVHSRALPFPAVLGAPVPDRVTSANATVTVLSPNARLLKWPNVIRPADWGGWVSGRTAALPAVVDDRYIRFIEVHDEGEPLNRNAILLAHLGKGAVVYTALTLDEQISGGIPGALRLLVNLMSAALPTPSSAPSRR